MNAQRPFSKELSEINDFEMVQDTVHDADLLQIIAVWLKLPEHIKKAIATLILDR